MKIASVLAVSLITAAFLISSSVANSQTLIASPASASQTVNGHKLGFWVDERDLWSGAEYQTPPPTPQQFVNDYVLTAPYPSAMLFSAALKPSGAYAPTPTGEAQWLSNVLSIIESNNYNVKVIILLAINISGETVNGVADQTAEFTSWMSTLGSGHTSILGFEYEVEYFGDTLAEVTLFNNIVNSEGYVQIMSSNDQNIQSFPNNKILGYSTYPYSGGSIVTSSLGSNYIGVGYGLIGAPSTGPLWTQSVITSIVDTSWANPYVFIYCEADTNNPAGGSLGSPLWNSPTLRGWIYSDPTYISNYILSTSSVPPPTTSYSTATTTSTSVSSTTITSGSSTTVSSTTLSTTSTTTTSSTLPPSSTSVSSTSTSTDVTTTSTTSTSTSSTGSTTASSTSASTSTTTSSALSSSATTQEPTQRTTSAATSTQSYALSVTGGCPSTGAGSYVSGTTATVEFPGVCDRSGGSGLRVTSWSLDGENAVAIDTNGTVSISVLMYAPHNISLSTVTQYSLTLDYGAQASILSITPPSIPGDNYWYDGGTVVTFVGGVNLQGYNVVDWTLDGASPVSVVGFPDFTVTMFMNQPHSLSAYVTLSTASCESEKCPTTSTIDITLQTNSSMPSGLWVDGVYYGKPVTFAWPQGSIHNVTAMEGERRGSVKSYFSGWSGESKSRTPTIMLTVNESGYLSADYSKEYLISLTFTDASGSPLVPQSVAVTGPSGARNLGANLTLWAEPAALYRITSATWMDWNVAMGNHSTFSISQPGSLTFPLAVYTQTIRVADAYNLPLQGATINVTTINGANIFLVTDAQGTAQFKVPIGLFRATVDYLGVNDQIVAASGGDHSYSVSFMLSYPLIATIGTVTAVSGAFVFLMLRKRKVDIQHSMDQS